MAELYVSQGHREPAIEIYRQLAAQDPHDADTRARLTDLAAEPTAKKGTPMIFREHLERIVESTPGALSAAVMAFDGIPINTFDAPNNPHDINVVIAEYVTTAHQLQTTAETLPGAGPFVDLCIAAENLCCVMRPLTDEYFLAVLLGPDGLIGKARFLMRLAHPELVKELS